MKRVLVAGIPRSGTSWVGRVLGSTEGAVYVGEPDNHEHAPFALRAKLRLPGWFYTALDPEADAADYELLWSAAFGLPELRVSSGLTPVERLRRRTSRQLLRRVSDDERRRAFQAPDRVRPALRVAAAIAIPERPERPGEAIVAKSVYAPLALEWLAARFPVEIVLVHRDPLNVLSSWLELGWIDGPGADPLGELAPAVAQPLARRLGAPPLPADASPLAGAAWLVGLLEAVLRAAAERHPQWTSVSHEALCSDARAGFAELAGRLDLRWSEHSDRLVERLDRPGSGYETSRVASELAEVWRERLTPAQAAEVSAILEAFHAESPATRPRGAQP